MSEQISIVVIDDDRMIRQILQSALSKKGFDIYTAENGTLGVEVAQTENVDLILLDWLMPQVDGMEVLKQLKSDPKTKHIPVFMLTGKGNQKDISQAIEAGCDDYIVKPFNISEIDKTIKNKLTKIAGTGTDKKKSGLANIFSKLS